MLKVTALLENRKAKEAHIPICRPGLSDRFIWSGEIASVKSYGYIKMAKVEPDKLNNEGALIYKSEKGLVIFTGCGHKGLKNIIEHCRKLMGINNVYALVGDASKACYAMGFGTLA